jgi:hypothetical protein
MGDKAPKDKAKKKIDDKKKTAPKPAASEKAAKK